MTTTPAGIARLARGGSASGYLLYSQLALLAALVICVPVLPRFLFSTNMGGVSNYGIHAETVIPYSLGILVASWLLARGSVALGRTTGQARALVTICRLTSLMYLVNLVTTYPYKVSHFWGLVHSTAAVALAATELSGTVVLATVVLRDALGYALLALESAGFGALAMTYFGQWHVLFVAEVTTGAAFGAILVRAAGRYDGDQ